MDRYEYDRLRQAISEEVDLRTIEGDRVAARNTRALRGVIQMLPSGPAIELPFRGYLKVGDPVATPFGNTVVSSINDLDDTFSTHLGTWRSEELYLRTPPDPGEDVTDFLLGARVEVRTISDHVAVKCDCSCGACKMIFAQHKLTKKRTFVEHSGLFGCSCGVSLVGRKMKVCSCFAM